MSRNGPPVTGGPWNRIRILSPLGERDFRLLWSGLVVSLVGDGIFLVAVAWQAYSLQNSPMALAGVGLAASLSQLTLTLLGGAVSDRLSRRTVLLLSDVARGTALVVLAQAGWAGQLQLWHLWVAAVVIGAGAAFASPAFDALVPELVATRSLHHANGLDQVLRPLTLRLCGPAAGGVLVALAGAPGAFLADAVTFATSAACVWRIRPGVRASLDAPAFPTAAATSLWSDLLGGLLYVRRHVWLWGTFAAASLTYLLFLGPTEVLVPYLVKNELHAGAGSLGLVLGAGGVGALVGAAAVGRFDRVRHPVTFVYVCWAGATLLVAGYGLATQRWELILSAVGLNALEAAGAVVWSTLRQRLVPGGLLGRVSSIEWFVSMSLMPLSFALTPLVAQVLGVRTTFIAAGCLGSATTLGFLFLPGMRLHDGDPPLDGAGIQTAARCRSPF
ncbi:MAG: major facilitator superfamily protein [Chloroflexi bacterium]|nr:major facilitator superfamily protein [Chloroflexota bacterium]